MAETNSSNLLGNLKSVYSALGGFGALFSSAYFLLSLVFALAGWHLVATSGEHQAWSGIVLSIFPSLAGFSIAAFALIFALIDQNTRKVLSAPSERFGGRSPLLMIVAIIVHALIVQMVAILTATLYSLKPFPDLFGIAAQFNATISVMGIWLLGYGILLMLAVVLTVFKLVELLTSL